MLSLVAIMAITATVVTGIAMALLYDVAFKEARARLVVTAQSQARLMEAVARFDAVHSRDYPGGAAAATISQIIDAHERYTGFGETGEFTIARREGENIVFIFRHRVLDYSDIASPDQKPVPFDSDLAEPMRRALSGASGSVIGLDYRGATVLAAYEPVAGLDLGIVAKIDLAEIRAPFVRAGLIAAVIALAVILFGAALFFHVGEPMVRRLRVSEEKFRTLVQSQSDLICQNRPDGTLIFANDAYCRFFGKRLDELVGYKFGNSIPEAQRERAIAHLAAVTPDRPSATQEHEVIRADGETRQFEWTSSAVFDDAERPTMFFAIGHDITMRKRAEKELYRLNVELEQRVKDRTADLADANEELEAFAYSVTHDLRTPLRSLDGFSRILLQDHAGSLDDKARHYLDRISAASRNMGQLIDDILALSRSARGEFRRETLDLSEMAREITERLASTEPERPVTVDIAERLEAEGDRALVSTMLENLLDNAWKFTAKTDQAEIAFGADSRGDRRVFFVRDNGVGFDMAYADKLFAPFQRLHGADEFEGNGVGLASVARVIRRHGGEAWAEGEVDKGATFYFSFSR